MTFIKFAFFKKKFEHTLKFEGSSIVARDQLNERKIVWRRKLSYKITPPPPPPQKRELRLILFVFIIFRAILVFF